MKLLARHSVLVLSKKRLFLIGGLLIVSVVAGYLVWSQQSWSGYHARYIKWQQDIASATNNAATLPTGTAKERLVVIAQFDDIAKRMQLTNGSICEVHPLIQWQEAIIPSLKADRSACLVIAKKLLAFQTSLTDVVIYAKSDAALSGILAAIPQSDELAADVWKKQLAAWGAGVAAVGKLSAGANFKPFKQLAVKQMTSVKVAWQGVIDADQAKNKQQYLAAQRALAAALDGLDEVSLASEKAISALSATLKGTSASAFDS